MISSSNKLRKTLDKIIGSNNSAVITAFAKRIKELEAQKAILANPWNLCQNGSFSMKRLVVKLAFGGSLAYDQKSGFRTAQPPVIFELLESFTSKCELAPPEGQTSNSISYQFNDSSDPANPSFDDIFEELERWHDVLEPHADELRGPRP